MSAAWIVPAAFAALNRIAQTHLSGWDPVTTRDLLWERGDWLLYALLTPFVFALSQRWPLVRPHLTRRAARNNDDCDAIHDRRVCVNQTHENRFSY